MCPLNNINIVLTKPIYLAATFILIVIFFLPAYVSLIILIILLRSFCFGIIKVSSRTMEYFQRNLGQTVEEWKKFSYDSQ